MNSNKRRKLVLSAFWGCSSGRKRFDLKHGRRRGCLVAGQAARVGGGGVINGLVGLGVALDWLLCFGFFGCWNRGRLRGWRSRLDCGRIRDVAVVLSGSGLRLRGLGLSGLGLTARCLICGGRLA